MSLEQGSRVFVAYDLPGPQLFHERLVLAPCACQRGWHVVLTPDGDMYEELLSLENSDLAAFHLAPPGEDSLPYGVTHANSYRFLRRPPADQMAQLLRDARHAAAAFLLPPGAGAAVAVPAAAPVAPQPAPVAGVDEKWVRIESAGENLRGALVELDGSEVLRGDVGLKLVDGKWIAIRRMKQSDIADFCGAEASADARLLGIKFQGIRREERTWRDVSNELVEETFQDWGVPGPRTSAWCVRFLNRRNGGPMDHHRWWMHTHGLRSDSWGATEHETLSKIIDKLAKFDGLDLSNLAGAEVTFRRLQLIEYFYSERGPGGGKGAGKSSKDSKKDDDGAYKFESTIFTGSHKEFGDVMVAPDLLSYVAKEVEQEASVMKQIRKAREERAAAAK